METCAYKLAEYKVTEYNTGELRWETHFGFGELKEGRCFKKGTILFLGLAENERPGFLKLEFIEHLKKLPEWTKTKYYCSNLDVYHCKTDKKVTPEDMQLWTLRLNREGKHKTISDEPDHMMNLSTTREPVDLAFRLNRYEIIKKKDGLILWSLSKNPNNIRSGDCIILEDILFLRPPQNNQLDIIQQQLFAKLQDLPKWDQTKYYCLKFALHECGSIRQVRDEKENCLKDETVPKTNDIGKKDKNSTGVKPIRNESGRFFSERLSAGLQLFLKPAASSGERTHFSGLDLKKPDISDSIETPHGAIFKKWFISGVVLMLFILMFFWAFLFNHSKEHDERRHDQKEKRHSSHQRDH